MIIKMINELNKDINKQLNEMRKKIQNMKNN